jgi:hypothetical protein
MKRKEPTMNPRATTAILDSDVTLNATAAKYEMIAVTAPANKPPRDNAPPIRSSLIMTSSS